MAKPEAVRPLSTFSPLYGLFDSFSFLLPEVDRKVISFLWEVVLDPAWVRGQRYTSGVPVRCLVALYKHPSYARAAGADGDAIFYRWGVWAEDVPIAEGVKKDLLRMAWFDHYWRSVGSKDFLHPGRRSLAAEFLVKFANAVASRPCENVRGLSLECKRNGAKRIRRAKDGIWAIDEPYSFRSFVETFGNEHKTHWCLYRPLQIGGQIAGVVAIDGMVGVAPRPAVRKRLAASLDLFELALEALFKKYYREPDYGDCSVTYRKWREVEGHWRAWSSTGVVYSSEFRNEFVSALLDQAEHAGDWYWEPLSKLDGRWALLYLDGNGIKAINDGSSHLMGNEVIRFMGRWLHDALWRLSGRAGQEGVWVVRAAGDEFIVLLCSTAQPASLQGVIQAALANHVRSHRPEPVDGLKRLAPNLEVVGPNGDWVGRTRKAGFAGAFAIVDEISEDAWKAAFRRAEDCMYKVKAFMKVREPDWAARWPPQVLCMDCNNVIRVTTVEKQEFGEAMAAGSQ